MAMKSFCAAALLLDAVVPWSERRLRTWRPPEAGGEAL
jgi:hypothetical protein